MAGGLAPMIGPRRVDKCAARELLVYMCNHHPGMCIRIDHPGHDVMAHVYYGSKGAEGLGDAFVHGWEACMSVMVNR